MAAQDQVVRRKRGSAPTDTTRVLTDNIRAEMARRRMPQAQLASALSMTQQAVSARLNGRTPIDVDELATIARELGVDPAALLEGSAS